MRFYYCSHFTDKKTKAFKDTAFKLGSPSLSDLRTRDLHYQFTGKLLLHSKQ